MWEVGLIALAVICVVFLVAVTLFFWRLRAIGSRVGSFECALLVDDRWRAGVATYSRASLNWYKVVSLASTPTRRFNRRELLILGRQLRQLETGPSSVSEARCSYYGEELRLAADNGALDGLVSWLEASPPELEESHTGEERKA